MPHLPRLFSARRIVVVLFLVGSAYAWWVSTQYGRLNAVNQLELQDAGAEITRAVDNAVETIAKFDPRHETEDRRAGGPGTLRPEANPVCVFGEAQPYLQFLGNCANERWDFSESTLNTTDGLYIEAKRGGGRAGTARWRFRMETLVSELALSDAFELILVADANGKVLFQTTPRDQQWERLRRWGERTFEDSGAQETGGLRVEDVTSLIGKDAVPGWTRLHAVSDRTTVNLAGQSHMLYVQPVSGQNGRTTRLVLGGLVPTQRLVRRALAVDTYFVAGLVVAFLLVLLGLPFVKLVSMSARERFRVWDVYALYLSCAALVTVATFLVMGFDTYRRWSQEADAGLETLATDLRTRITTEIQDIRELVSSYDSVVAWRHTHSPCLATYALPRWPEQVPAADPSGRVLPRRAADKGVFVDQVAWIAPTGQQVWKLTSDPVAVLRDVSVRPYFRAVQGGHLYLDPSDPPDHTFFVAPDRSISDGRFYTFLSMPSQLDDACVNSPRQPSPGGPAHGRTPADDEAPPQTGYVAVASTRLLSVERAAVPGGYGFAVVTRDGRALYHSDPRLRLRENLFDHLDESDLARAIAQSGRTAMLAARYREEPYRLHFSPLPWRLSGSPGGLDADAGNSAGLTLVTFRAIALDQALVARAFVVSLGPMLLLVSLVGMGLWAAGTVSSRRQGGAARWLWPHGGLNPMYRIITGALVVLLALTVMVTGVRTWPYLLLPALAAAPGLAAYGRGSWHTAPRRALARYGWYTSELTLMALAMLVVPAAAVVNLTLGHEFGVLIESEQQRMQDLAADAPLALRAEARTLGYPDFVGQELAAAHAARQRTPPAETAPRAERTAAGPIRPAPFDVTTVNLSAGDQRVVAMHEWINEQLPAESALLAKLRYYDVPKWYLPAGALGPISWVGAVGVALIIVAVAWWARWSARHLHAADLTPEAPVRDDEIEARWNDLSEDERHVLLQATEERIANPRQHDTLAKLASAGLLKLSPDIQPATRAVAEFLDRRRTDATQATALWQWERTHEGHSWQAVRPLLFAGLGAMAFFLFVTQPGLQSELLGVAGSAATLGATLLKLRDAFGGWLERKAGGAGV